MSMGPADEDRPHLPDAGVYCLNLCA
ncbi:hypothetical protein TRIP_C60016 [Candidatus Zixiibacteriota bacterium]|nr:hypothetical protein TRIP_C60016 [candidate division Zixibacteria bacterium]